MHFSHFKTLKNSYIVIIIYFIMLKIFKGLCTVFIISVRTDRPEQTGFAQILVYTICHSSTSLILSTLSKNFSK